MQKVINGKATWLCKVTYSNIYRRHATARFIRCVICMHFSIPTHGHINSIGSPLRKVSRIAIAAVIFYHIGVEQRHQKGKRQLIIFPSLSLRDHFKEFKKEFIMQSILFIAISRMLYTRRNIIAILVCNGAFVFDLGRFFGTDKSGRAAFDKTPRRRDTSEDCNSQIPTISILFIVVSLLSFCPGI